MLIKYGGASCDLNHGFISCLWTDPDKRRKGHAKRVLRKCIKWAEENKTTIDLSACPYRDRPMSLKQLVKFYSSLGFKETRRGIDSVHLEYKPRTTQGVSNV